VTLEEIAKAVARQQPAAIDGGAAFCPFCRNALPIFYDAERTIRSWYEPRSHAEECPWVAARRWLEESS
jgi:hypothetical protein